MTAYKQHSSAPVIPYGVAKAKEKRKRQLDAVWERRKSIYAQYRKKLQAVRQEQQS